MEKEINFEAKKVGLIAFSILLISFVCALPPIPPLPDHFMGNVTIDGQNAVIGTQISIYVDSELESVYSISEAGKYDLYVKTGIVNITFKSKIEFKIQDMLAGSATRGWGETVYLDLSVTTSSDGGSSGGSGGSGGGGGGGGIISPPPTTDDSGSGPEETIQTQEIEEQETSPGITGAVVGFLESGKGITIIIVLIVLSIGVILIKSKTPKWKRN